MPCFHPLHGYTKKGGGWTPNFSLSLGSGRRVTIPCGQCIGCRLERSRQWAIRCIHEASMFGNKNVFVTLTYRKECLPEDGSLDYRHFQLFMKKLRKKFVPKCPFASDTEEREAWLREHEIRFYMCGEYGDENGRPHYHAILFNCQFEDKYYWRKTPTGYRQYRSKILDGCFKGTSEVDPEASPLWIYGNAEFADVSFKSCAYVARYIMKKVTGDAAAFHYADVDPETGEVLREVKPEFSNMSRRPGIGHDWLKKFQSDVYPHGYVVHDGHKTRPPRYYDNLFKAVDPKEFDHLVLERGIEMRKRSSDMSPERLAVKEHVAQANLKKLVRPL